MELLDLSKCVTNKEVTDLIRNRVKSVTLEFVLEELNKDYVYLDEVIRKLYVGLGSGKNCLFHGPGGFGKSEIIKSFCELLGIPVSFKVGYEGMTSEELFGVPNMKKLLEESLYETSFENSVFNNKGLLILEEFLDCDPSTASSLKDILTEKGFREKDIKKESFISNVIIVGNKSPDELNLKNDDSLKAFYEERFPIQHKVVWNSFEESNYLKFLKVYYKDELYSKYFKEFMLLSRLCSKTENIVSPRTTVNAGDIIIDFGIDFIDTVSFIDTSEIIKFKKDIIHSNEIEYQKKIILKFNTFLDSLKYENNVDSFIDYSSKLVAAENRINLMVFSEENIEIGSDLKQKLRKMKLKFNDSLDSNIIKNNIYEQLDDLIKNDN